LTANLQLRPVPQPSREPAWSLGPGRPRVWWSAFLAEPRSSAPPRFTSRRRSSRPRAGPATRPLASLVASPGGSGIAAASPSPRSARSGRAAVSSKTTAFAVPGRLPSTSAPSPGHACAFAPARGITGSPPPVSLLACSWLSPPRPGFRRLFTCRALPRERGSRPARPRAFQTWTERRSSTSATNSTREHDRGTARSPPRVARELGQRALARSARLRSPASPPWDPIERQSRSSAGRPLPAPSTGSTVDAGHEAEAQRLGADGHQPRVHGPGLDEPKLDPATRPDPLGHLSS